MKALTLHQPWASLVALGKKRVETRGWLTSYRGPLAIHAALRKVPGDFGSTFQETQILDLMGAYGIELTNLPFGCILCVADLTEIRRTEDVRSKLSGVEIAFGNYYDGRYAWFFEHVRRLENPIPAKGNRMLWNWDETPYLHLLK